MKNILLAELSFLKNETKRGNELYDQIWLSPALAQKLIEATIGRRHNLTGDGSDHDPAWVRIQI